MSKPDAPSKQKSSASARPAKRRTSKKGDGSRIARNDSSIYSLRIAEILGIKDNERGKVAKLSNDTGLSPFIVKNLLQNLGETVSLRDLATIADFLEDEDLVNAEDLPGALFTRPTREFFPMSAKRKHVEMFIGVRVDPNFGDEVVNAADSKLQATMLHHITNLGPGAVHRKHPEQVIAQHTVKCWKRQYNRAWYRDVRKESVRKYAELVQSSTDLAAIFCGSIKSLPMVELMFVNCFKRAECWKSEDDVPTPGERSCPFVLVYRPGDPHPKSCCAGLQLSASEPGSGPGIYYEKADGDWEYVPWEKDTADCALVVYRVNKARNVVEVAMGGFSSRGSRCLEAFLRSNQHKHLWPCLDNEELAMGAFVLKFPMDGEKQVGPTEVIRLESRVLQRRLTKKMPNMARHKKPVKVTVVRKKKSAPIAKPKPR